MRQHGHRRLITIVLSVRDEKMGDATGDLVSGVCTAHETYVDGVSAVCSQLSAFSSASTCHETYDGRTGRSHVLIASSNSQNRPFKTLFFDFESHCHRTMDFTLTPSQTLPKADGPTLVCILDGWVRCSDECSCPASLGCKLVSAHVAGDSGVQRYKLVLLCIIRGAKDATSTSRSSWTTTHRLSEQPSLRAKTSPRIRSTPFSRPRHHAWTLSWQ